MRKKSMYVAGLFSALITVFALSFHTGTSGELEMRVAEAGTSSGKLFADKVGNVKVGTVPSQATLQVPYILWGGDMITFHANGGTSTKSGSIYSSQGLKLKLVDGNDFVQQVRDYISGKSPFLRCTFRMCGMASEIIGKDPRTKGVVVMQMTWSAGDHLVVRQGIRSIDDLKRKKIAIQYGGPHVGMLDDILGTAQLKWSDVNIVWTKDITGTGSPGDLLKKKKVDAAFVVTPDMLGLTGGRESVGGAEGTLNGATVLISTAELSRSIADIYLVRKDFYDAHQDVVKKFVAGYLKASEEVVKNKAANNRKYKDLLKKTVRIYGTGTVPNAAEADGLYSDCRPVGYAGNVEFFEGRGNLRGFAKLNSSALEMADSVGFIRTKTPLLSTSITWSKVASTGNLTNTSGVRGDRFRAEAVGNEIESLNTGALDDRTIYEFSISFAANQTDFPAADYRKEFDRVMELSQLYGGAVIVVRGHSDPTKTLVDMLKAGMKKGVIKRKGSSGNYSYYFNNRQIDLKSTESVTKLIGSGAFDGVSGHNPRETMQAAQNLSRKRADAVSTSLKGYAKLKGVKLDKSQIQPQGVGIREPVIAKPSSMNEASKNMRVEFRIVRVSAETTNSTDFDF